MNFNYYKKNMFFFLKKLYPNIRSITGPGIKDALSFFEKINPELKRLKFKSGKKIFDWTIPDEWFIKNAHIIDLKTKKKIIDYKNNNLHVVNFSKAFNKIINKDKLLKKIYYLENQKNAIPYITSYYKKDWGFCIRHNDLKKFKNDKYKVLIDSNFKKGHLELSHAVVKGRSKKEIFFSSYLCHPSMANNELSGPLVLNGILKYVSEIKNNYYSYRFVIGPETIGSICYLSKFKNQLKKNVIAGFNLSCLGDNRNYSIVYTRKKNTLSDHSLHCLLKNKKNFKKYDFLYRGSDERQYNSPLVDLPVCNFSRTKFGEYKEYHTSLDNLNIVNNKNLKDSLKIMTNLVDDFEKGVFPISKNYCEPFLTKYKLYPTISKKNNKSIYIKNILDFIAYSDGKTSLFEISNILNLPLLKIKKISRFLQKKKLIKVLK